MKKNISICILCLLPLVMFGQDIIKSDISVPSVDNSSKNIEDLNTPNKHITYDYMEVVNTNLSKEKMWINLKKWISSTFNNYKFVVDLEDKENGSIVIKWEANLPKVSNLYFWYRRLDLPI